MGGVFLPAPMLRKFACILVDTAIIAGALLQALVLRFAGFPHPIVGYEGVYVKLGLITIALGLCFYYNDLYSEDAPRSPTDLFVRVGQSFLGAAVLLSLVYYAVPELAVGRGLLLIHFVVAIPTLVLWRALYYKALRHDALIENVLILGTGPAAIEIGREVLENQQNYRILGFLSDDRSEIGRRLVGSSVIGTYDDLPHLIKQLPVRSLVVALEDRRGKLPLEDLLRCRLEGIRVEEAASFYEALTGQIPVRSLRPSWLIFSPGFSKSPLLLSAKRALDFSVALIVLVFSFPLMVIGALCIWLESGRPILYRQERVGEKGKRFTLCKLRTMKLDAEEKTGPVWASPNGDHRVTRVGRFLRSSRIDELPQLVNVLRGEMSFTGPRPERPVFAKQLEAAIPYFNERLSVKPGITGWAQVKYGYGSTIEEGEKKLRYDLYYIKHMNPLMDFMIMLDTAKVILLGRGAR